jgi:tetratricopeptide (TPR) repeat protein
VPVLSVGSVIPAPRTSSKDIVAVDREKVVSAAQKYAESKRYDRAIVEYQKITAEDPNDARTLLKIGDLQLKLKSYEAAVETYERVGKFYSAQGFSLKAIAVFKQIRDIIARHVPALEERYGHILPQLAELYRTLGLTSDALAAYDEVGTKHLKAGRDAQAVEAFRKIVTLDEDNPLSRLRLAEALARVKDVDGSIEQFSLAADILVRLERVDDALKVVDRLLQFRPDPQFAKRAARLFLERGQHNDGLLALAKLQIAFQANNKDVDTLELLARAFEKIDQRPKAVEVQKELARIAREQGNRELFQRTLDHLLRVAPNDEVVKSLVRSQQSSIPAAPPQATEPPASVSVEVDEEDLDEIEIDEDEEDVHSVLVPSVHGDRAIEETSTTSSLDVNVYGEEAISEAIAYRRAGLYGKAIECLRIALEVVPYMVEVREQLRDVLLEVGDRTGAANEMITLAWLAIDNADGTRAVSLLNEVLLLFPTHAKAREILADLGYEPHDFDADDTQIGIAPPGAGNNTPNPRFRQSFATAEALAGYQNEISIAESERHDQEAGYDPSQPLPSYDLEEIGPGEIMSSHGRAIDDLDEPFAAPGQNVPGYPPPYQQAAEPSYQQGYEAPYGAPYSQRTHSTPPGRQPLPSFHMEEETSPPDPAEQESVLAASRGFQGGESVEDALEEVDFFASRGLYEDARAILDEQLARLPNNRLLLDRLRELDEAAAPAHHVEEAPRYSYHGGLGHAGADEFNLDSSLDALDNFVPTQEAHSHINPTEQVDVESVFAKFKEGVRAQVSDADSQTHYDLGVAYREMGLLDDSIGEFYMAAHDPTRAVGCFSMVGMIEQERGNLDAASQAYIRALHEESRTVDQEIALYYELGVIFETKGNKEEALYYFQKVQRKDPTYREVEAKILTLTPKKKPGPPGRGGAQDDFDSVFDDILANRK